MRVAFSTAMIMTPTSAKIAHRARKKVTREVSLYEPIGTDKEGNEINLIDVCEQEQRDIVDGCFQILAVHRFQVQGLLLGR